MNINPTQKAAIFSISPKRRSEGTRSSVGFVIYSDQQVTLGLTAYHGVKPRMTYQAIFNNKKADLHFVAANAYSDFALVAIPTQQLSELRPTLPLTARDPGRDKSVTCLGFPEIREDDKFGGHLTRSTLPNSGISSLPVTLLRYLPNHDIEVQPALPGGFSGGPVIFKGNVIGLISASDYFAKTIYPAPFSKGPSAAQLICELYRWGNGMTGYFDVVPNGIEQPIKSALLQITR